MKRKPKLAVFKFSSCDGCQLQLLNLEDDLLDLVGAVDIAYFLEARRRVLPPPYDIGLVEGSVSTPEEEERIQQVRRDCKLPRRHRGLRHLGRNPGPANWASVDEFTRCVYRQARIHLHAGDRHADCRPRVRRFRAARLPGEPLQLLELVSALLVGRKPNIPTHSCASSASGAGCLACSSRKASPAWGRSPRPAAAPCARAAAGLLRLLRTHGAAQHRLAGQLVHPQPWAPRPAT